MSLQKLKYWTKDGQMKELERTVWKKLERNVVLNNFHRRWSKEMYSKASKCWQFQNSWNNARMLNLNLCTYKQKLWFLFADGFCSQLFTWLLLVILLKMPSKIQNNTIHYSFAFRSLESCRKSLIKSMIWIQNTLIIASRHSLRSPEKKDKSLHTSKVLAVCTCLREEILCV